MSRKFASWKWRRVAPSSLPALRAAASSLGRASACAAGSTSNPTNARISGCALTIALACPPAPIVPSTYARTDRPSKHSMTWRISTGTCGAPSASA